MARTYHRDSRGRFASGGGSSGGKASGTSSSKSTKRSAGGNKSSSGSSGKRRGNGPKMPSNPSPAVKKAERLLAAAQSMYDNTVKSGHGIKYSGPRLAYAKREYEKAVARQSGDKKTLAAIRATERHERRFANAQAAEQAVASAKKRAGRTVKGVLAKVKRIVTGTKRKPRRKR